MTLRRVAGTADTDTQLHLPLDLAAKSYGVAVAAVHQQGSVTHTMTSNPPPSLPSPEELPHLMEQLEHIAQRSRIASEDTDTKMARRNKLMLDAYYLQGATVSDICRATGLNHKTVKAILDKNKS